MADLVKIYQQIQEKRSVLIFQVVLFFILLAIALYFAYNIGKSLLYTLSTWNRFKKVDTSNQKGSENPLLESSSLRTDDDYLMDPTLVEERTNIYQDRTAIGERLALQNKKLLERVQARRKLYEASRNTASISPAELASAKNTSEAAINEFSLSTTNDDYNYVAKKKDRGMLASLFGS
jgi:hypothetical protein